MNLTKKPSGLWWVDFVDPLTGKRRRVSTGLKDKAEAHKRARDIVLGIDTKPPGPASPTPEKPEEGFTVAQAFDRAMKTVWKPGEAKSQATIRSNVRILSALEVEIRGQVRNLGRTPVTLLSYTALEEVKITLERRGYAAGTVKRKMDALGKVLTMCTRWTDASGAPILHARPSTPPTTVTNSRKRVLTDAEEAAIERAIAKREVAQPTRGWARFRQLLVVLADSGIRLGEATSTKASQFVRDEDGDWSLVLLPAQCKSGKGREVPCSDRIVKLIPLLQANAAPDGTIFPYPPNTAWYAWTNIRDDVREEGKENIDDVVLHTYRHTCLTRMSNRGVPIEDLCDIAGHHDISITKEFYVHKSKASKKAAIATLNRGPTLVVDNTAEEHAA